MTEHGPDKQPSNPPLSLGTRIRVLGEIAAVIFKDGERYYMLVDSHGGVSLMPASVVETLAEPQ